MTPRMDPSVLLIESAITAFRELGPAGKVLASPAWWDLADSERAALFEAQMESRLLEAAIDQRGLSSTAKAVLERTRRIEQISREGR